tara:strand:+ start:1864 stop:3135 length:1272 start_codon:yes stop_codon:yes gene_type:complete
MIENQKNLKVRVSKKTYDYLCKSKYRINLIYGGAGSGKSWPVAQYLLIEKFYAEKNIRIVIARATMPSLRKSCWLLMLDFLKKYDLPAKINKSNYTIEYGNNTMFFVSLDDVSKLKSIEGINYVWVEEADETVLDDYLQLNLRARGANENGINQLFYTFNPSNEMSYLKDLTDSPPNDVGVCHSTYKDNTFLPELEREQIEKLIDMDVSYHKIYALGQWASLKGTIYTNWEVCKDWPESFDDTRYGLDFGYNNPTALVEINYLDDVVYLKELLYESGLTNPNLIDRLDQLIDKGHLMVADCAEPDRIEEIYQHDYDVHACHKGVDSVRRGIDIVRSKKIYYHLESDNLRKESSAYKWREDAKGNGLDEPVKFNDHLMDAVRYGIAYGEDDIQIVYGGEGVEEVATMAVLAGMDDEEDEWKDWE